MEQTFTSKRARGYSALAALALCLLLGGCVVKDISSTVEQTIKGDYFLQSDQISRGRESFRQEVAEKPQSALANYYYGRFLLKDNAGKEALGYLKKARDLNPDNPDYYFWTGIAYGSIGNSGQEEKSYRAALRLNRKHLQALIYLGHNRLQQKQYTEALQLYTRALDIWPGSPAALYNRALILQKLGRTPEEMLAWQEYLLRYPSGAMARRAVEHLNGLGDFSYRNHHLGARTVTIEKIRFEPFEAQLSPASAESLDLVGSIVGNMPKGVLQVVVYQKNNKDLAHRRARAVRDYLLDEISGLTPARIGISWFDEPERVTVKGKKRTIDESISFFIAAD